ncbi:hypothetical protein FGO68_gene5626 [Halteria grandinella]|uniref:RING-type domain-containing protein n=1 Tax=Halteria grandinella TaxID=5974 RepID=A0A8J8NYP6_HALGN|nr:hypothetical protein FGO68_gene5626 [Halteria grandinella]
MAANKAFPGLAEPKNQDTASDSFFGVKQPRQGLQRDLPPMIDAETVQWRNIRPNQDYMTIRKMFLQDQKKRKFSEMQKAREDANLENSNNKPKYGAGQQFKKFRPNPTEKAVIPNKSEEVGASAAPRIIPQGLQVKANKKEVEAVVSQAKENTEAHKQAQIEEQKQKKLEEEKKEAAAVGNKMPLMFIDEVNKTLDRDGQALFKEALMLYKTGKLTEIDQFTDKILTAFFKASLNGAMNEEQSIIKLRQMCPKVEGYPNIKKLANEVAQFIAKKQRERFYYVLARFSARYENIYPDHSVPKSAPAAPQKTTPIQPKPPQQQTAPIPYIKQKDLPKPIVPDEPEEEILCCVCYQANNLYVSKCKHVACLSCWNNWLEKTLECPQCRNRTRKNQIFPMNNEDRVEIRELKKLGAPKTPKAFV